MKYAEEVIELMECYPGREFRMAQIVRHISKSKTVPLAKRHAIREGVKRVLAMQYRAGRADQRGGNLSLLCLALQSAI